MLNPYLHDIFVLFIKDKGYIKNFKYGVGRTSIIHYINPEFTFDEKEAYKFYDNQIKKAIDELCYEQFFRVSKLDIQYTYQLLDTVEEYIK